MRFDLRPEVPADHRRAEELIRDAFWDVYVPGAVEHYLLHILRGHPDFVPELTYVAGSEGRMVGHIAYSKAAVLAPDGAVHSVLSFGPIGVLPEWQGRGVGEALIKKTLDLAAGSGCPCVVIMGDPRYYHRMGFRSAEKWDISCEDGKHTPALMAYPLSPAMPAGRFIEPKAFTGFDETAFQAFDASFPAREKGFKESQKDFAFLSTLRF